MIFVGCALLVIALATLWPQAGTSTHPGLCLTCGSRGSADVLLNIALFMPLGAALARRGRTVARLALYAALLSGAIELSQFFIPGRDPTIGDVVANTLGAVLGGLLFLHARTWLLPATPAASRLCRVAALTATFICFATGFLLAPSFPAGRYFGLWTPQLAHLARYQGSVIDAAVYSVPIADGSLAPHVRDLLKSREGFELGVRAVAGPPPQKLAPVVAIVDDRQREILLVGVDHEVLVFRERMRAVDWRFDHPDVRVRALAGLKNGDTLRVTARARGGHYAISGVERGFTVAQGWTLLAYRDLRPFQTFANAMWIGALFVPAGFWWRTRQDGVAALLGLVAALLVVPALTPLLLTPAAQWLAAGVGLGIGAALRRVLPSFIQRASGETHAVT